MRHESEAQMTDNKQKNSDQQARENLELIRRMMEAGRQRATIDGSHMIIWGFVLMIAFFAQYASVMGEIPSTIMGIWLPAFVIGTIASVITGRNQKSKHNSDPVIGVYQAAWGMTGIASMIYFFTSMVAGTFSPESITLISAALFGGAYFVIAGVTKIKQLYIAAIGWWGLLAYVAQVQEYDQELLLVLASACGILILIPGFLMRRVGMQSNTNTHEA